MSQRILEQCGQLVDEGSKLTPLGGFDFSGYNVRLQDKYLAWRKACLEILEGVGPIGFPYKNKIAADPNGGFFYQASAQLIFSSMKELLEKLKASPDLLAEAGPVQKSAAVPAAAGAAPAAEASGTRTLKPPARAGAGAAPQSGGAPAASARHFSKAYVIGELNDPLRQQLSAFLEEVGVKELPIDRIRGEMISLDTITEDGEASFAFFIMTSDDLTYAMFELGHFVGKLGKNHVMVLHMTDVEVPKNIPGVVVKPIVVKLEEASLSIIKELRGAGYTLSI